MNKFLKNAAATAMMFALLISAFQAPVVSVAHAQEPSVSGLSFELPALDFNLPNLPGLDISIPDLFTDSPVLTIQTCKIEASETTIPTGGNTKLTYTTSGFDVLTLNGQTINGSNGTLQLTNILQNTTYELVAKTTDGASSCVATVTVTCVPPPSDCRLEVTKVVDKATASLNDILTYTITVKNVGTTDCTGSGVKIEDVVNDKLTYLTHSVSSNITPGYDGGVPVYTTGDRTLHFNGNVLFPNEQGTITWTGRVNTPNSCGDFEIPNQAKATALELNNFNTWVFSQTVKTLVDYDCPTVDPAPICDSFVANPTTIVTGGNTVLTWNTTNASRVIIDNGIGERAVDGTVTVSPTQNTTYRLTAFGTQNRTVTCDVPVVVSADPIPVCQSFTATPNSLPAGGGSITLAWNVTGATAVSIAPTIGSVAVQGSQATNVTASTNYVLTATDADGDQVTCAAPVTVASVPPPTLSCRDNVTFTASDTSIDEGDNTTLTWSTTNLDSVSISVINSNALSGSVVVNPNQNTTYVLTGKKGTESFDCPLTISVDEDNGGGGGGGGSSSPRCELTLSDKKIKRGEEVTLTWDTSRARDLTIKDDKGKVIVTTEKLSTKEKDDLFDGSKKLKPTRDTEYTLVVERGSKDRTCKVSVDVDDLTIVTNRDQQPLVAGISLSNVPYTGFEAGTFLTFMFYALLVAWALFVTYLIVMRPRPTVGVAMDTVSANTTAMKQAEMVRPDVFVPSLVASETATAVMSAPANLPVAAPVIGYEAAAHVATDSTVAAIENRAHTQMALLSSDAIRHFISTTEGTLERDSVLDQVIAEAKAQYPLEDGWIVVNEARMRELCVACKTTSVASENAPFIPAVVPEGSSSLAEAIVTGNIVAAYEMIGSRPMFALADAAADLDAVVRNRRGEQNKISTLLATETEKLSDEKIKNIVAALTGALDGTYTDEASAVKMAILKAVKEVA